MQAAHQIVYLNAGHKRGRLRQQGIIASAMIPDFIWLASGSLQGLNPAKCAVLKGRTVMLSPDANGYDKWKLKARQLHEAMPDTLFSVSTMLETIATEEDRQNGIDIGDVVGW